MAKTTIATTFNNLDDLMDYSLLEKRRIFISDGIDNNSAKEVIRKLWFLDFQDPGKPILLVINSPGGSVDAGFAIWDQAKLIRSPITTLVTGLAASFGSILSLLADKGKRFCTPNARIMIHQPLIGGVIRGQATDLEIHAKEISKTKDEIIRVYVEATGKSYEEIAQAIDRDCWLDAEEAKAFGLIDKIVSSKEDL
ncbi:MAG: ATP-dependent Clp protease proteolytic subunit [Chlamydiales bacterium]|nr:ATP-dependent Clp protease proteolytic subunit [Chlamydiales bacterium]NCF70232.1 ATP-dependent Clp protease proteolytic subunit [Chlamydiales bacterium]